MNRRTFLASSSSLVGLGILGCSPADTSDGWQNATGTKVLASFAPIQCFAMNVAGEDATVRVLFGDQGPHHIKDHPSQVSAFAGADVLFMNGLGLEDRNVNKLVKTTRKKGTAVSLGSQLPTSMLLEGTCNCAHEHDDHADHAEHAHHDTDPHIWLGIDQAVKMVEAIRDELRQRDPAKAANYNSRAASYREKLLTLKNDGLAMLKDKKERQFISFHDSLKYFAKNFDLKEPEVIQINPGQEPTQKELEKLISRCVNSKLSVIAIEPQYGSGTSAKAVASELEKKIGQKVQLIVVDPLETATDGEMNANWYETKMRANLEALAKALK